MRIVIFTTCLVIALGLAFFCGWLFGLKVQAAKVPEELLHEREETINLEWWLRESSFRTICLLDEKNSAKVKDERNLELDMWIINNCCASRRGPYPNESVDRTTLSFLARLAWHRMEYPVVYNDATVAESISNVFMRALEIEKKR